MIMPFGNAIIAGCNIADAAASHADGYARARPQSGRKRRGGKFAAHFRPHILNPAIGKVLAYSEDTGILHDAAIITNGIA